jgi:hypothetical protein
MGGEAKLKDGQPQQQQEQSAVGAKPPSPSHPRPAGTVGHELPPFAAPSSFLRPKTRSRTASVTATTPMALPPAVGPSTALADEEQMQGLVSTPAASPTSTLLPMSPARCSAFANAGLAELAFCRGRPEAGCVQGLIRFSRPPERPARLPSDTNELRRPPHVVPADSPG